MIAVVSKEYVVYLCRIVDGNNSGDKRMMIEKDKIKAVFVDIDDTVWWFTENSKVSLRHVYDAFELNKWQPEYETFRDIYSRKNVELWHLYHYGKISKSYLVTERFRYTLEKIGVSEDIEQFAEKIDNEYLDFLAQQRLLVPGAKEMLEYLNGKYRVYALSNGFKGTQQRKLQSAGVEHLISKVIISDDCGYTKPMKEIFDYALGVCGCDAQSAVMIGDNADADIRGAHNAGWKTVYFNMYGKDTCNDADAEIRSLDEVRKLL